MPGNDIEGRSAQKLFNGIELETALSERRQIRNHFKKINDQTINVCHFPVYLESKFIGVASTFQDVTHIQNLENQIRKTLYTRGFVSKHQFEDIITKDPHMAELKRVAAIYAKASSAILIQGESGTGKELFAQSIHSASACKGGPFVAINCGAIPETLLESELFGHETGAFTGAKKMGKPGLFELAHNGTLFLVDIAEMPLKLQARLLRVIQERELIRIGGDRVIPVNVRIISATNKKLADKVKSGDFREDLYYRLAVFDITLPPLRERKCDIPALFGDLLASMCSNPERTARICEVLMPL
jgi:transcriptional regulator with PAS, ATPase and Fis domain